MVKDEKRGGKGKRVWEEGVLARVGSWNSERATGTERVEHKQTSPRPVIRGVQIVRIITIRRHIVRIGFRKKGVRGLRLY